MTVEDVFCIKGRGTVVVGLLGGDGLLGTGYLLECDGQRWWSTPSTGGPGGADGHAGPDRRRADEARPEADVLRGRTVRFTLNPAPADGRGTGRLMRKLARRQG